jgi:hypothetical protein
MGRAYEAPGCGIEHHGGIIIICQKVQVRVRYDRVALIRPHHQCTGGTGAPREDRGHSGLVDAQERDRIEELLQAMHLLQAVRPRFFLAWSTANRSYQECGLHMDREITRSL